ncbi:hypothetical protein LNO75_02365 [Mycoplasma sp. T363T]|uniref:Uncharacterized protein n=1 Tax=Mycoplasma bradburyae TaxID=2963128 RepID=A0AAW6HP51_9MOLU|nr:hypothetical protein [Mycoplasma bradburyae]MDC4163419.1 hypothetical protein [Mycoplasma bradburyae]MDC4182035.1 hypothetical protein [Mycoplasma bradburyae]MDC4182733.1 hypothetical protein [Mycoplasma bradburyae]MDC4183406.1 hypothetical protein [Mycoplasma bradburyae]UTS70460.1 hypothetical protein NMG68_01840 [Mycoplasma bradburyae]
MDYFKSSHYKKTKPWIITLFLLIFVFGYYLTIWVLLGEFNLLKLNWLLGEGVIITNDQQINERNFNLLILIFLIPPLGVYFILILIIKYLFKQTAYDLIPLTYSFSLAMITTILSGLFNFANQGIIIFARIVLVITVFSISFFFLVFITNKLLIKFDQYNDYVYLHDLVNEVEDKNQRKLEINKLKQKQEETIKITDKNK